MAENKREVTANHERLIEMVTEDEHARLESVEVVDGVAKIFINGMEFTEVKPKNVGDLSVTLDLDASDAIKTLKAVQREAREATKALRELEATEKEYVLWSDVRRVSDD